MQINLRVRGIFTFWDALSVLFVGLKLTGYIDWEWWIVVSPVVFSLVAAIIVSIGIFIYKEWIE